LYGDGFLFLPKGRPDGALYGDALAAR
jgi:hypothetical protein